MGSAADQGEHSRHGCAKQANLHDGYLAEEWGSTSGAGWAAVY